MILVWWLWKYSQDRRRSCYNYKDGHIYRFVIRFSCVSRTQRIDLVLLFTILIWNESNEILKRNSHGQINMFYMKNIKYKGKQVSRNPFNLVPRNLSRMMLLPRCLMFSALALILTVQGDLIAWNRLRNNAAKHYCKRTANFRRQALLAQYQQFFKNAQ